jgi:hypothetical protein
VNQKTIVAGMAPPIAMPPGVQVPGAPPGMGTLPGGAGAPQAGANKTVMLQPSDGVVSVASTGRALQPVAPMPGAQPGAGPTTSTGPVVKEASGGASALFWIVSMVVGIGIGVLAYVIVLQTQ